jgi:hypothetical protein
LRPSDGIDLLVRRHHIAKRTYHAASSRREDHHIK